MTKKIYVIGSNTSNSLSPLIFNYWFKKKKIDAKYLYLEIKPENFDKEINLLLKDEKTHGFNVTIPFKERMLNKVDYLSNESKAIGATNCVVKNNNKWIGENTDWTGFLTPIKKKNWLETKNNIKSAVVIGYGGASKAIIYALKKTNINKIKLFNRTFEKIKYLDGDTSLKIYEFSEINNHIKKNTIIINTTPINPINPIKYADLVFNDNIFGYDLVYRPKETLFLSMFKKNNRQHGIQMLLYQAIPCFESWFGIKPDIDEELYKILESKI